MKLTESAIRQNWAEALKNVEYGTELSMAIGWAFTTQDLLVLCALHEANLFREKIYDLLEDCNFHYENGLMNKGKYEECRKAILENM